MRQTSILHVFITIVITNLFYLVTCADINDCAVPCSTNVSDTNCTVSNWPCLCADGAWVDRTNACVMKSCNTTEEQESAFLTLAQLCAIFDVSLTASPEATFPASLLSAPDSSNFSALLTTGPGPVSVSSLPSVSGSMKTSVTATGSLASSATVMTTTTATAAASRTSATTSATQGSGGNAGSTRAANGWFALAVLMLAGAAIL